ncbi:murein biosynthesis integral membrane protein MurJ [Parvularcula sp. LCG005]|uniref:murein biosynthesis integral membrane protein MurJ n=1 Tax=Parvularcula sp. LCG005 TaxID=3078805 RepID=UPI00294370EB|nr:murein biosynthesis integral membrane protein MurJ [Parvularcula sp. LCG005]WOI52966.1 murein biosynthesis integral membrane protein MurJ [Parvularcula sp. LCG005]
MARPLLKSMATVSGLTMVSRVLGFARQMLIAGIIGASGNPVADAFWAAFRLPNMFRRLLAEGAFQAAFVPLFQRHSVKGDMDGAKAFAEDILAWMIVILTGLSAIIMIFAPVFVSILTTGFRDDPERFNLTILYTRIMFPYLACMSLVGIYGGMLGAMHKFAAASAAPLLLNIALITGVLAFADAPAEVTGLAAAWSVMIGGLLQLGALVLAATRSKLLLRLRLPRHSGAAKRMLMLGTPGFIGAAALQVNGIVGTNIASREAGAVSWLMNADQLYQLPLAIIGIALGVVLMPAIGRSVKSGDETGAKRTLNRGVEVALFFALPATAALMTIPVFLCGALFQDMAGDLTRAIGAGRSAFNDTDVAMVGAALAVYGIGLPAFVLQKVFAAAFFAREDTKSPMTFALVAIAINATISITLFPTMGFIAVPIGTVVAAWVEVTGLSWRLYARGHLRPSLTVLSRIVRMVLVAGGLGWLLRIAMAHQEMLAPMAFDQDWILLFELVGAGVLLYFIATILTGGVSIAALKGKAAKA